MAAEDVSRPNTCCPYASGAVRRFANLAGSEDWLGLMNVVERADDPGTGCLVYMVNWSLKKDEALLTIYCRHGHGFTWTGRGAKCSILRSPSPASSENYI